MQANQIVYPQGSKEITLAANESIAVQSVGKAQVFRKLGYPNFPDTKSLLGTVSNTETVFGPYTSGRRSSLRPARPTQLTRRVSTRSCCHSVSRSRKAPLAC